MSREIRDFARSRMGDLVRKEMPSFVLLFGSAARGTATRHSDLDLLVVMESREGIHERAKHIWPYFSGWGGDVDVIVYTPDEWAARLNRPNAFTKRILSEGLVLHGT